jgi:hypothetical protein
MIDKAKLKSRIIDYFLAVICLMVIPIIGYIAISSITPLNPILYVISSLSGFYIICFLVMIEIHRQIKSIYWKIVNFILLILAIPLLGFYGFDLITPISLSSHHFAEAGFSYIFSAGVAAGYELLIPRKK